MSRIYGGIHFPFDNVAGKTCGRAIGDYVAANFLLPNDVQPHVRIEGFRNSVPELRMHGRVGVTYILEASLDLTHWHPVSTNVARAGGIALSDPAPGVMRFYRAIEQ